MKATRNGFPSTSTRVGLLGMVVGLILAGCNQPVSGSAGTQAWIDAPLHESTHPVAPMEIVLHGADPGGVAMIELSINGEVLSRRPPEDTSAALSMMKVQWDPAAAGEYVLVARAQDHSGAWSPQASSVVTLIGPLVNLQMVTPTSTPTTSVTPTPTPTPACVDRATFVADVRIPDNTVIAPGGTFVKVWRLRNDGTCPWDESYSVVFVDGHPMSNPTPMPIPEVVQPGATVDISLPLVAPTSPGTYRGDYQIRNPQGVHFGVGSGGQTPFYVQIVVAPPQSPTRTPTQPPPPDTQPPSVSVSHSPPGSTASAATAK